VRALTFGLLLLSTVCLGDGETKLSKERIVIRTSLGDLIIALYPDVAPVTVAQILKLVRLGLYDSTLFFKVDPSFGIQLSGAGRRKLPMLQQQADALHPLKAELSAVKHRYGTVTMAHDPGNPDSAQMSFLIMLADVPAMDGKFTAFGEVVDGKETLETIRTVPTDQLQQPLQRVEVYNAFVVDNAASMPEVPRQKTVPSFTPAREELPPWFGHAAFFLLAAGLVLALLSLWVFPHVMRALGFIGILGGYFLFFALLTPQASASRILAIGLFFGSLALFKLMSFFEVGEAGAAMPSTGSRARSGADTSGSAPSESTGKHVPRIRSGR
jgi:cyclophilin family peptidyl-prolyl cis-trans isomerase